MIAVLIFCKFYSYPSRLDYDKICSAITLRYPFLADYDGSSVSECTCTLY